MSKKISRPSGNNWCRKILSIEDRSFNPGNVCIVTSAATGIGRATAIAAAANSLMTVGIDSDGTEGKKTQKAARELGGQMIFLETDLKNGSQLKYAVSEASKIGKIRYLGIIPPMIRQTISPGLKDLDTFYNACCRMPFYLSRLVTVQMEEAGIRNGVIGNIVRAGGICGSYPLNSTKLPMKRQVSYQDLQKGAKDYIRHFNIHLHNDSSSNPPAEWDVANLFLFGFSRFASSLSNSDLFHPGTGGNPIQK